MIFTAAGRKLARGFEPTRMILAPTLTYFCDSMTLALTLAHQVSKCTPVFFHTLPIDCLIYVTPAPSVMNLL